MNDELTIAVLEAVITLAKNLLKDKAMLLTSACSVFLEAYMKEPWVILTYNLHIKKYVNFRWVHKKFGTILYKHGGDLFTSLSWAVGANAQNKPQLENIQFYPPKPLHDDDAMNDAANHLNDLLHEEICKL
jgi:hypothetical protein